MSSVIEVYQDVTALVSFTHKRRVDGVLESPGATIQGFLIPIIGDPTDGVVLTDAYTAILETDRQIDYPDVLIIGTNTYTIQQVTHHDNQALFDPFWSLMVQKSDTSV